MHKLIITFGAALLMASTASARDISILRGPNITRVEIKAYTRGCFHQSTHSYTIENSTFKMNDGEAYLTTVKQIEQLERYFTLLREPDQRHSCTTATTYTITAYSFGDILHREVLKDTSCVDSNFNYYNPGPPEVSIDTPYGLASSLEKFDQNSRSF